MTIEPGRLRRALHLTATRSDFNSYTVNGGAAMHTVTITEGRCVCDCYDYAYHGDGCKHCLLVRLLAGEEAIVTALRDLVPLVPCIVPPVAMPPRMPRNHHDPQIA